MPIYEYTCKKCKKIFSALQSISSSERDTECPVCGSKEVKKMLSTFSSSMGTGGAGFSQSSSTPPCGGGGGG